MIPRAARGRRGVVVMRTEAPAVERWADDFGRLLGRVGPCFGRHDLRAHDLRARAGGYVRGLLGRVDRKNGRQVAEYLGDEKPYGVQRLLGRASWDADAVRDEVRRLMLAIAWPLLSDRGRALAWSDWRRRHQAVARRCHYHARDPTRRHKPKRQKQRHR